jgi:hypothetical protein
MELVDVILLAWMTANVMALIFAALFVWQAPHLSAPKIVSDVSPRFSRGVVLVGLLAAFVPIAASNPRTLSEVVIESLVAAAVVTMQPLYTGVVSALVSTYFRPQILPRVAFCISFGLAVLILQFGGWYGSLRA